MSLLTRYVNRPLTIGRAEARLWARRVVALPLPGKAMMRCPYPNGGERLRRHVCARPKALADTYGQSNLWPHRKDSTQDHEREVPGQLPARTRHGARCVMPTNHFSTRPLYLQLRDALAERVAGGEWRPGAAIPNEGDLAREFGVSAGTMRKALDLLEDEHLLTRRQGRGTFVNDQSSEELVTRFCNVRKPDGRRIVSQFRDLKISEEAANEMERARLQLAPKDRVFRAHRIRLDKDRPFMVETLSLPAALFPESRRVDRCVCPTWPNWRNARHPARQGRGARLCRDGHQRRRQDARDRGGRPGRGARPGRVRDSTGVRSNGASAAAIWLAAITSRRCSDA